MLNKILNYFKFKIEQEISEMIQSPHIFDLPDEMILECCKKMDFKTRINLKKTCHFMNRFLINPKSLITDEQVKRWQEKVKLMFGYGLLANVIFYQKLDLSKSFEEKIYMDFDISKKTVYFQTSYYTTSLFNKVIKSNPRYEMEQDGIRYPDGQIHLLFSKFKLKFEDGKFKLTSNFLIDLYIYAVCEWQHKNKSKVMKLFIAEIVRTCFLKPLICFDIHQKFSASQYLNIPFSMNMISDHFRKEIEEIREELMKEMKPMFLDGDEAFQYMNTCKMFLE